MKEFMESRFQIKSRNQPINILDILDMMIAPDVDAYIAANGVRENEIACRQSTTDMDNNSGCTKFCSDERFSLTRDNCLYLSTDAVSQFDAVTACQSMGPSWQQSKNMIKDGSQVKPKMVQGHGLD